MEKKHYIIISVCALLCVIGFTCFGAYYRDYIKPKSYSIGVIEELGYKKLAIKDYLSDDDVIFSQNINDGAFTNDDGIATYEYNFDAKEFNGEENDYIIYVNNYVVNNLIENAGTIGGTYNLDYYDVEKQVLCSSAININFSFYSLQSKLKVTLNNSEVGYLMKYFETDNFVITLAKSPFLMMNKDIVVETPPIDELSDISVIIESASSVVVTYCGNERSYDVDSSFLSPTQVAVYDAKSKDSIVLKYSNVNRSLSIETDGTYTKDYDGNLNQTIISWEGASYVKIIIFRPSSSGSMST